MLSLGVGACGEGGGGGDARVFERAPEFALDVEQVWFKKSAAGGHSSPRLADFTGDGVLDVVIGAGLEKDFGKISLIDGATGHEIWGREYHDQVYSTAVLDDVSGDGVPDVLIGRRKQVGDFDALDGRDGSRLWALSKRNPDTKLPDLHFNTAVPLPDQDGDAIADLLVLQSGGKDQGRPTGRLWVVSAVNGKLLAGVKMPDGKESYCVPALQQRPDGTWNVIVGTGGETVPGHVISLDFPSFEERWRYPSREKGFVASGVLHDFDGSGRRDYVISSFEGTLVRLDGDTGEPVWEVPRPGFETYSTPGLGRFNEDDVLDVVQMQSEGTWPQYLTQATILWVDGRTGEVLQERRWGVMASASPDIVDFDGDGFDETIFTTNLSFGPSPMGIGSLLGVFDGRRDKATVLELDFMGWTASTPWLGDMDGDGRLDLVHAHSNGVLRLRLDHPDEAVVYWNQYRGETFDGVVPRR